MRRLRVEPNWDPHLNFWHRESEGCRHDADDFRGSVVKNQGLANDAAVTAEMTLPERVAQDAHVVFAGQVFFRHKRTAHHRIYSQNFEKVSGHLGGLKTLRGWNAGKIHAACGISGNRGKHRALVAIGCKIRLRKPPRIQPLLRISLQQPHQPFRLRIRQGPKQDTVYQTEDCSGNTDPQR